MWSALITIALGLYLIYSELGNAFVATIIITIVIMLFTPYLSRDIRPLQTKLSGLADKRIRLISGILRQIRAIKLSAYETELIEKVSEVRKAELLARKKFWHKFYRVVCMTSVTMNALSLVTLRYVIFTTGHQFFADIFVAPTLSSPTCLMEKV